MKHPAHIKASPTAPVRVWAWVSVLVLLAALLCFVPAPARAAGAEAEEITEGVTLSLSNGAGAGTLLDCSRNSFLSFTGGETIEIASDTPFYYLYLVWDTPPEAWTLATAAGETTTWGQSGYLHELVSLPAASGDATIQLGSAAYTLCDIYLFGAGTLPSWVQQWQPMLEKADLLALPTHADDEHLFYGGILPTYAGELGLNVQVVYMTNHWGERYRPHELLDGLWTVGVTAYPLMGPFPDLYASKESLASAEQVFGHDAVLAFQVEILRRFKPMVVVGHDLAGEYGHGAHMLNAETLLEALPLCGDETAYPESAAAYGVWEVPKAYLHLYAENEIVMDWNQPLARFDGATAFEVAEAGFAKHVSQREYFSVRQDGTWQDCRKFGLAHTLVGPDVAKNDLFENIDLTPEPEPEPAVSSLPVSSAPGPSSLAPPPSSLSSPGDEQPASFWPIVIAGAIVVVLVVVIVLILTGRTRKRKAARRAQRHIHRR